MTGRFWQIDFEGFIQNDARDEPPQPPFDVALDAAVEAFVAHIGQDLDSIYVTGSVARGLAVPGQSDLNVFAVTHALADPDLVLQQWIDAAEDEILARHPGLRGLQMELWPYYYVFNDPARFSMGGFILKTHSRCVWGSDLAPGLPDYRLSPAIANDDLVQLEPDFEDVLFDIETDSSTANVAYWSRRSARAALWSSFGLVQMAAGVHTRDLDLCAQVFLGHFPQHRGDIQRALHDARQPVEDPDSLRTFLKRFNWLLALTETWLDEHNPDRDLALRVDDVEEPE